MKDESLAIAHDRLQRLNEQLQVDLAVSRTEAATLRSSGTRYLALFDNMLEGYAYCQMLFDHNQPQDFLYIDVNKAFEQLTGLTNVVGKKVSAVIPGIQASNPDLFETFGRVALTGRPARFETYVEPLDIWFSIAVTSPEKEHFVAVFDNITERKRTEAKLTLFRTLIDRSSDAIEVLDPKTGRFLDVNERACLDLGYTREEVLALSVSDVDPTVDHASFARHMDELRKSDVLLYEGVHRRKNGSTFPVEVNIKYVRLDRDYIVTVARDITGRKRIEESWQLQSAALDSAADGIVITDPDGIIEWVNSAFTELTGYTAEEAVGKHHRDLVNSGKQARAFYKDLWETILAGRTWRGELINRRKDGSLYTSAQAVTPIPDAAGVVTHFVAIQQDVTERRQLEAQFRQAQRLDSVGQLASGIAHDFNNLLTVINGMSELLLAQVSQDDPVHADIREIRRAGERAAALTRQLLAFSRQQILEPRVLDVNKAVTGMESLLRRLLAEDINLVIVPTQDVSHVKADPGQIEQVIVNLTVNARDAMPEGGQLTIEVQTVTIDEEYVRHHGVDALPGPYVMLSVSDSGTGMDEATRTRIFEPFFTTKGPGKGTGLGLAMVHGIVKQSHGFVGVDSEVGHGTRVRIYLPQVTAAAVSIDWLAPTVVSSPGTETILLVEDNAQLRKLATRFLEPTGYTVLGAGTGEEALRLLEHHQGPVHLLLTDVVMPGMSGGHLAERLAQIRPAIKVLYMSGYTDDAIVRHGVLEARVPFLNKPFTAAELLRKVRDVLDSQV
jgi:two-component system cell cycle sensor histidine kinase/response regulator CckA